jgi:type I restriction enzyme, R subunit
MEFKAEQEIKTQDRIVKVFKEKLNYDYLGDWKERENNTNIEDDILTKNLKNRGYNTIQINLAINKLRRISEDLNKSLYQKNKDIYEMIRYGVQVKEDISSTTKTISLVDWNNINFNHFAIAEEVTLKGNLERRPDLVVYINGIAFGVIELKKSTVSVNEGIRQSISNQQDRFNEWFYSTVQFTAAGNDSEGLRYGTIKTPEQFYLKWKEDENETEDYKLDKYIKKIFKKERILELIFDFIIFDGGKKKVPRANQYFAIKEAQKSINRKEGGIIWHTQGSGKSIIMVLLSKWILENNSNSRVIIITDREDLDDQIEDIFNFSGEKIYRAKSGKDLIEKLDSPSPRLLCSLIHKFGKKGIDDFESYIKKTLNSSSNVFGEIFVMVDECHRTQSGKLHKLMKSYLKDSIFIGFTGTPLLKKDKKTSIETFGKYIHRYLLDEAVTDKVILDIVYEARDVDQFLGSKDRIDQWFDSKTKNLNKWQKISLKKKWTTMQSILSSESRSIRIVNDIIFDFSIKPRLCTDRGTAMLVANNIFEACRYYELFNKTELKDKCAIITSYNPNASHISLEDTGANSESDKEFIFNTYEKILKDISSDPNKTKSETYEDNAKKKFKKEPHNMKLLIVVDKLLTGFDAPSCTYLYIDKSMQDHALFQAICRTNRLDGEDKDFGYIVDYKDLLKSVEKAISVYTSDLDNSSDKKNIEINIYDKFQKHKEKLENTLKSLEELSSEVKSPQNTLNNIYYFCGNSENPGDLKKNELKRNSLYKLTASLIRTYANIANDMITIGYSEGESFQISKKIKSYTDLRDLIKNASGEYLDLKTYESDMRHLIDTYIEASDARKISNFENTSLVDLIVKSGISELFNENLDNSESANDKNSQILENNFRKILDNSKEEDPEHYREISIILDNIIEKRKNDSIEYQEYLEKMEVLASKISKKDLDNFPVTINRPELKVLYNNLFKNEDLTIKLDENLKKKTPNNWRNILPKERMVKQAIYEIISDTSEVERVFEIIKNQENY